MEQQGVAVFLSLPLHAASHRRGNREAHLHIFVVGHDVFAGCVWSSEVRDEFSRNILQRFAHRSRAARWQWRLACRALLLVIHDVASSFAAMAVFSIWVLSLRTVLFLLWPTVCSLISVVNCFSPRKRFLQRDAPEDEERSRFSASSDGLHHFLVQVRIFGKRIGSEDWIPRVLVVRFWWLGTGMTLRGVEWRQGMILEAFPVQRTISSPFWEKPVPFKKANKTSYLAHSPSNHVLAACTVRRPLCAQIPNLLLPLDM